MSTITKFHLIFPPNYQFFNERVHDVVFKHMKNDSDFIFHFDLDASHCLQFIKDNMHNDKLGLVIYLHPSVDSYEISILNFIHKYSLELSLKVFFFTFDFWLRPGYDNLIKKIFECRGHYVYTFADNIQILNSFHNADYTLHKKRIIFDNIWCCYDRCFMKFNTEPINRICLSGAVGKTYPDRLRISKFQCVLRIKYSRNDTIGLQNNFNRKLNQYVCCFTSPTWYQNPSHNNRIENTHLITLKVFEILGAGSLLLYPKSEEQFVKKIGLVHKENCWLIDMSASQSDIQSAIDDVLDVANRDRINTIRKNGQDFAKEFLNSEIKYKTIKRNLLKVFD